MFGLMAKADIPSWEKCKEYCASLDQCKFWAYNAKETICNPKENDNGRESREGFVSGPRSCEKPGNLPLIYINKSTVNILAEKELIFLIPQVRRTSESKITSLTIEHLYLILDAVVEL